MKKIIFISANVEIFNKVSVELQGECIFVLADSVEKAIEILLKEGETFDYYFWDNNTTIAPRKNTSRLIDILGNDFGEYTPNLTGGVTFNDAPFTSDSVLRHIHL